MQAEEVYLRTRILDYPLTVVGSGQDEKTGQDRGYTQTYNGPDGVQLQIPGDISNSQMVQINYELPDQKTSRDTLEAFDKGEQYLRGLSMVLSHKGYAAMWERKGNDRDGVTLAVTVAPRPDMGNTNYNLVVTQNEIVYDIRDAISYLGKMFPNKLIDSDKLSKTLDLSIDSDAANVMRSFPKLRKEMRKVASDFQIKDSEGVHARGDVIEKLVSSQYPGAIFEAEEVSGSAPVGPKNKGFELRKAIYPMINGFTIEDKDGALASPSFVTKMAFALLNNSPGTVETNSPSR